MITYRSDIDGLRAVAVVPVVLYHAGLPWLSGGFVGVDVFFVISGFLITSIIAPECAAGQFSLLRFYERRARRILPALFFVVAASVLVATVMLLPDAFKSFAWSVLGTLGFVSNIWFWSTSTGYFAPTADLLPLLHTWSLAVEEQFYIFYPLLLALLLRRGRQTAIIGIVALTLLSLGLAVWATPTMPAASFYLLPTRAWEMGCGALLALGVGPRRMHRSIRESFSIIALAAILLPVFLYNSHTAFPGLAALPPVLGTALLILIGATGSSTVHRVLGSRVLVAVGVISYSLYLWHWPVLAFLRVYSAGPDLSAALAIAAVCLSTLMAYLSWRYVERPFRIRAGADKSSSKARGYSPGAIARFSLGSAAVIGVAAGLVLVGNGWPSRIQDDVLAVARTAEPTRFRMNCMRQYAPENTCRIGVPTNPGDPVDLLLIGDSHAAAVAGAFDLVAREAGLSGVFFGNVSCAPLVGVVSGMIDQQENCRELMQEAVAFTHNTPGLRYVALVARWPVVVERDLLPGEPGSPFPVALDTNMFPDTPGGTTNAFAVTAALPRTLDALSAPGIEFLLLGPIPEINWNVPDHLIAHLRFGNPIPADPDIASVLDRQSSAIDILKAADAARLDTTYIPVAEELCQPDCPTHDEGTAFYWDDDHLSPAGAERLIAPLLRPFLTSE